MQLELPAELAAAGVARSHLRDELRGYPNDVRADAELVLTELVSNAILHGASATVSVNTELSGESLRIEVGDQSREPPTLLARLDGEHGRGLRIVAALAASWGVTVRPGGKSVWCVVELASR